MYFLLTYSTHGSELQDYRDSALRAWRGSRSGGCRMFLKTQSPSWLWQYLHSSFSHRRTCKSRVAESLEADTSLGMPCAV